jgi:hypothetical protein
LPLLHEPQNRCPQPCRFALSETPACGTELEDVFSRMFKAVLGVAVCCGMAAGLLASGGGGGCGGGGVGGGFCGFGGDSGYPFELPKVEEDVDVGGLTLKLDRTKWGYSVFASKGDSALARFIGDDIEVTLRRIAPPSDDRRRLVKTLAAQNDVLCARAVATSGALRGVKAAYGIGRNLASREQTVVRYFIAVSDKSWLCFEARPTGKAPQWRDANDLIFGAKPDRSQS